MPMVRNASVIGAMNVHIATSQIENIFCLALHLLLVPLMMTSHLLMFVPIHLFPIVILSVRVVLNIFFVYISHLMILDKVCACISHSCILDLLGPTST